MRTDSEVISRWYQYIAGLVLSPAELYQLVEWAFDAQGIRDARRTRTTYAEGGLGSPRREYLRLLRHDSSFEICGMPFGKGFAVSWWLMERQEGCLGGLISAVPLLGYLYQRSVKPVTFYKIDSALMFQSVVHDLVLLPVLDNIVSAQGVPAIAEAARRPTMRELLR
ncbi:MAG: hypothetical protein JWO97_4591 [Acidobacteria bacterium]|nr:hypothetical protein [Acidobacteriota bacterium]